MSEEDDFDIVPDDEGSGPSSNWLWVSITAVVALFAFGVGVAFMILSNRMGSDTPTATPTNDLAVVSPTQLAAISGTATITTTATITATGTPTATPTISATVTPSATATPFCTQPVESLFVPLYDQGQLGCPTNTAAIVWAAFQPFERGSMLWRSDADTSYVFYSNGDWFPIAEGWDGGPSADRGAPPPGLQTPQRGFGYVWSRNDDIFNGLGWARDQEKGFCALVQEFDKGFMLRSADVASCTPENLYNFAASGEWTPLVIAATDDEQWRNVPSPNIPTDQGGQRPEAGLTRPAPNGIFNAFKADGISIDGNFDDWPNQWIPLNAIVYGAERHAGPGDFSANFQVGWTDQGLVLAVRVNDDVFRASPQGTDLWKGDAIEVQFDRQLAEDYNSETADADDYQVGFAYDNNLGSTQGYLWLPFERETALGLPSAVTINDEGYQVEFVIPWYVFEVTEPSTNTAYGFNISVNDNDGDVPTQETVLSASPARLRHDNPTQFGTLRLIP